jgi:hypothetical protein
MAKLRNQPVTAADLEKYLASADDFAFELRCLHSLSERPALRLEHGGTYTDPVSEKSRQFDIRARMEVENLRVSLAVECKNISQVQPLLVSRVPRAHSEAVHNLLVPEPTAETGDYFAIRIPKHIHTKSVPVADPLSVYKAGALVGKSVTRVGVGSGQNAPEFVADDSEVFDRWAQAISSAYDLISEADDYFRKKDADPKAYWIVPVLVVPDGVLWVADYDTKGTVQGAPYQVDEVEIYLDHSACQRGLMISYSISHLHFVTAKGLLQFVDRILVNEHFRGEIMPDGIESENEEAE